MPTNEQHSPRGPMREYPAREVAVAGISTPPDRGRSPDSGGLVKWAESSIRSAAFDLHGRTRPLVFNDAVHKRVVRRLGYTVQQGTSLYVQGAVVGVGASVLVQEFARQFSAEHRSRGVPDQILVVRLHRGIQKGRDLLSVFALALQVKFTQWELRMGDKTTIGEVIAAEVRRRRVRAVVFDHVSRAGHEAQALIAEFMFAMNPLYARFFDQDPEPAIPTAVILVDESEPEVTFSKMPDVLTALGGSYVELSRYKTLEHIADALRDSGIGLSDLDLGSPGDQDLAAEVLKATDGLIANMDPLLGLIDYTARSCLERPSLKHLKGALLYHRKMVDLSHGKDSDGREVLEIVAKQRRRLKRATEPVEDDPGADSAAPRPGKKATRGRSRAATKEANLELARQEKADLQRQRDYTVLPDT